MIQLQRVDIIQRDLSAFKTPPEFVWLVMLGNSMPLALASTFLDFRTPTLPKNRAPTPPNLAEMS